MRNEMNVPESMSIDEAALLIVETARDDGNWRVMNWQSVGEDVGRRPIRIRFEWEYITLRFELLTRAADALWAGIGRTLRR